MFTTIVIYSIATSNLDLYPNKTSFFHVKKTCNNFVRKLCKPWKTKFLNPHVLSFSKNSNYTIFWTIRIKVPIPDPDQPHRLKYLKFSLKAEQLVALKDFILRLIFKTSSPLNSNEKLAPSLSYTWTLSKMNFG